MPKIPLTQGQVAIIDQIDYEKISTHKWCAQWAKNTKSFIAVRGTRNRRLKTQQNIRMHREIFGLEDGDSHIQVDHKNHNTLDNRRSNLRLCDNRSNQENRIDQSRFGVGISMLSGNRRKPFQASIHLDRRRVYVGCFATPEEAQEARRKFLERIAK